MFLKKNKILSKKLFFFDMKIFFFQKYFLDLKKFQIHCYEILDFPQNGLAHFVGSPRFHNSEILVPPKSREQSIFPRFIWEAEASNRQTVKSFIKYRSRRAREIAFRLIGARKHLLNKMFKK